MIARSGVRRSSLYKGLVACYGQHGANGTNEYGRNNDLTLQNAPTSAVGIRGNALSFATGSSQYANCVDSAELSTGDISFTIACWFNAQTLGNRVIAAKAIADLTQLEWDFALNASNIPSFDIWQGLSVQSVATIAIDAATWYFARAWVDIAANTVNLQINNSAIVSATKTITIADTTAPFSIGAFANGLFYWDGRVNAFMMWRRVLTPQEGSRLYNGGGSIPFPFPLQ